MDEEDYINDLGWNTADNISEDESSEDEASIQNEIKSTALASPKQAVDPQPGTSKDYANEEMESFDEKTTEKKLGRPPKSVYLSMQPTRGSTRLKKKPDILSIDDNSFRTRTKWSEEDKRKLLTALEMYGPDDIKAICTVITNKKSCDVRNQIEFWKDLARSDYQQKMIMEEQENSQMKNTVVKLDAWLEYFSKLADTCPTTPFALSEVFILISEYGKFPPPEECDGVDFRAMYRYLHCMLNGLPYFDVNPRTAQEINDNLKNMATIIKDYRAIVDLNHHINCLAETPKNPSRWKNYGRQPCRGHVGSLRSELIMNLSHLNPLKIPPHLLTRPEPGKGTSDCCSDSILTCDLT